MIKIRRVIEEEKRQKLLESTDEIKERYNNLINFLEDIEFSEEEWKTFDKLRYKLYLSISDHHDEIYFT